MAQPAALKEIFKVLPFIKKAGKKNLWFDLDDEADILYISLERPQSATDTDIMDDGILLRYNGKKLVGITISNFSKRF